MSNIRHEDNNTRSLFLSPIIKIKGGILKRVSRNGICLNDIIAYDHLVPSHSHRMLPLRSSMQMMAI
ncbi:hypothetical protein Leryth_009886 [Lithospermum erythrorhizon]|nr:hypothetical protein Leryth_009886 [Lithospermum erythrorhizon]